MNNNFQVSGTNDSALFSLKLHRGDGMTLVAMNWKNGEPSLDFAGFAIEYKEPNGARFFALKNRLGFSSPSSPNNVNRLSTLRSPIQKFRWVHFPRNAEIPGEFTYRVTPVFMNDLDELSLGEPQTAAIELRRETYPGLLNVTFTRGFVSSQAFVDRYLSQGPIKTLLPSSAKLGIDFEPTHPNAKEALDWMGFEARSAILEVLDKALADPEANVKVVAYDLSEAEIVRKLVNLGSRLQIIIDDDGDHGEENSGETIAAERLKDSAGEDNVKRQHMGNLQHNKTIIVSSPTLKLVVCGSTNFSWRGFFVQANNAIILTGDAPVEIFTSAFDAYFNNDNDATLFGNTSSAEWTDLMLNGIDAKVAFSPHSPSNAQLESIADDINNTQSSLLYSLAFLFQTGGPVFDAINSVTQNDNIFVYGISDKEVKGIDLQSPEGNVEPVFAAALDGDDLPEPFKAEITGGTGTRMHHKFLVIDFDKPSARVYMGSYNFSNPADRKNGENLLLIKDRRIAVSYMIEAIRIFDHYQFRVMRKKAQENLQKLELKKPPRNNDEEAWWKKDYTNPRRSKDRILFS